MNSNVCLSSSKTLSYNNEINSENLLILSDDLYILYPLIDRHSLHCEYG